MDAEILVQPPFEAIVAEYAERFGQNSISEIQIAKARRRCAELGDLMLRAFESGAEPPSLIAVTDHMIRKPKTPDLAQGGEDLVRYWQALDLSLFRPSV